MMRTRFLWFTLGVGSSTATITHFVFKDLWVDRQILSTHLKQQFEALDTRVSCLEQVLPNNSNPNQFFASFNERNSSKPFQQMILDNDYTFTTPYCGSTAVEINSEHGRGAISDEGSCKLHWEDCEEQIGVAALALKELILFYDEVIFYEDELADSGVSLLTVKVRVVPSCWFLLLRFWHEVYRPNLDILEENDDEVDLT